MNVGRVFALALLALLLAGAVPAMAGAHPAQLFKEVPTQVCVCQSTIQGESSTLASFRPADSLAPAPIYDEQLGTTFTQSFTSLAFNVTAVEQTDSSSGEGPAYLLNGLTGSGFWYQVGVSYNWNPGTNPGTGFAMSYEVFNAQQASVFPTNGNGGLQDFSGTVNQGDIVLLNLYFSSGDVMMVAHDWNTGASASESYTADGSTSFQGDSSAVANSNGFFTGLMTEWYHPQVFLSNEKEVVYSESDIAITSAWMWMDEFNPNGRGEGVFSNETSSPLSFTSAPATLQEFSSNGATEYMDAHEFITGALNATVVTPPTTVKLTFSYAIVGGGTGYSPPVLTYVSKGSQVNATLGTSPTTFEADIGTGWNVTGTLSGSTQSERWTTDQQTGGNATAAGTFVLDYYHQYAGSVSYSILGAPTSAPDFSYTSFGSAQSAGVVSQPPSPTVFWADAGTDYAISNPLGASNFQERWISESVVNGTATGPFSLSPVYYQQFLVSADYATIGGGDISAAGQVYLSAPSFGSEVILVLSTSPQTVWLDAGSAYGLTQSLSLTAAVPANETGLVTPVEVERWTTNSTGGVVVEDLTIVAQYQNQYLVTLQPSPAAGGGLSTSGGWYDAGSELQSTATANGGWKVEYWAPAGSPGQIISTGDTLSVQVNSPVNDTAVFYAGLTVSAGPGVSVSYSYASASNGSVVGQVPAGTSAVVYSPASGVKLTAATSSFPYSFGGWSGASSSGESSITLAVTSPETISARSSYNYLDIAIILGALILLIAVVAALASRRQRKTVGSPAA
jgi:hypothetical protein